MSTPLHQETTDKAKAEALVSTIPLIPEVQSVDVELYTDWTGDPAFQIVFHLRKDVRVDDEFLDRYSLLRASVEKTILYSDLDRFPYTRLEQAA